MNNYELKFVYPRENHCTYGMLFEDDVPEFESEKYIADFLSENGFIKNGDNEWIYKNGMIVTVKKIDI